MLESKNLIVENRGHIRFILDGKVKTLPSPVTGAAIHIIADNPTSLEIMVGMTVLRRANRKLNIQAQVDCWPAKGTVV